MSKDNIYYSGALTLEEFRKIVRELESQGLKRIDPFEHVKNSPVIQKAIDEAFKEQFGK